MKNPPVKNHFFNCRLHQKVWIVQMFPPNQPTNKFGDPTKKFGYPKHLNSVVLIF